jgi:hypothetical protein
LTAVKADEKGDETVERLAFAFGFNPETRIKLVVFFHLIFTYYCYFVAL